MEGRIQAAGPAVHRRTNSGGDGHGRYGSPRLEQSERDLRNQVAQELKTALAQVESARAQVDAANLGVNLAMDEVVQPRDRFRAGVANNIEVVTGQDDLARANDNRIAALYSYNQARADLARATGQMEALYSK